MLAPFKMIRTYVPVNFATGLEWPVSEKTIIEMSETLAYIISDLRECDPIGRVGNYTGVYEISFGLEGFTPVKNSHPTLIQNNSHEETPSVSFATYVSNEVDKRTVNEYIDNMSHYHPWEHPVIEVISIELWMPT